jgi:hypothetical protein
MGGRGDKFREATGGISAAPTTREWAVMLEARSSVRLQDDTRLLIQPGPDSTAPLLGIRLRNGFYRDDDGRLVFKGLIAEARGLAVGPDDAVGLLAPHAAPYLHIASTAANGSVDEPRHLLAHSPPTPGHHGGFTERRPTDIAPPAAVVRGFTQTTSAHSPGFFWTTPTPSAFIEQWSTTAKQCAP